MCDSRTGFPHCSLAPGHKRVACTRCRFRSDAWNTQETGSSPCVPVGSLAEETLLCRGWLCLRCGCVRARSAVGREESFKGGTKINFYFQSHF